MAKRSVRKPKRRGWVRRSLPVALHSAVLLALWTRSWLWYTEQASDWRLTWLVFVSVWLLVSVAAFVAFALTEERGGAERPIQAVEQHDVQLNGSGVLRRVKLPPLRCRDGYVFSGAAMSRLLEREQVGRRLVRDDFSSTLTANLSAEWKAKRIQQRLIEMGYIDQAHIIQRSITDCYAGVHGGTHVLERAERG